jgi:hypothetical protein
MSVNSFKLLGPGRQGLHRQDCRLRPCSRRPQERLLPQDGRRLPAGQVDGAGGTLPAPLHDEIGRLVVRGLAVGDHDAWRQPLPVGSLPGEVAAVAPDGTQDGTPSELLRRGADVIKLLSSSPVAK